jgi:hypothetical protein
MTAEHATGKMDIFQIFIYAMEAVVVAAVVYGMMVLPSLLKPVP